MKQLLELNQDYILEGKFRAKVNKAGTIYEPDWIDDKKEKANGKNIIENVAVLVPVYDREGYSSSTFQKVFIPKDDIVKLSKRIEDIESIELIGVPNADLPF